jgi:hypothetical protein
MAELSKSAEQVPGLRDLIEAWCDRRCLNALKYVLPAYLSFNGRIDGWSMLCAAVRNARTFAHEELTEGELETICLIVRSAKEIIYGPPSAAG